MPMSSTTDCINSLALVASEVGFVKPEFVDDDTIDIVSGRHPMVEALRSDPFVPNDVFLGGGVCQYLSGAISLFCSPTNSVCMIGKAPTQDHYWCVLDNSLPNSIRLIFAHSLVCAYLQGPTWFVDSAFCLPEFALLIIVIGREKLIRPDDGTYYQYVLCLFPYFHKRQRLLYGHR